MFNRIEVPFERKAGSAQTMVVPMEIKAVTDEGKFGGYASIFGNVDLGGDIITKDRPFKEIVTDHEGKVLVLFQHDTGGFLPGGAGGLPIGKATVEQDEKGLKFDAELVMDDPFVQRVHKHLKARTLRGMSIGFDILAGGAKMLESGVRELSGMKLWEISVVTFGMNPKAQVERVKSARSIREIEDLLRDAVGLSRSTAKAHAADIWKTLGNQRDAENPEVLEAMRDITRTFQSHS